MNFSFVLSVCNVWFLFQHDYPNECRPGGVNGNFIMFASATSGDRPNNSKFSPCSVGNISNVLDAMVDNKKRNCFTISAGAFCGNKIVEAGEECDCGYDNDECTDTCCYPRIISDIEKMKNDSAKGCHRRYRTQCRSVYIFLRISSNVIKSEIS
jgi:disintegrin and metalloproteinase domain-containing protein 10